MVLFLLFFPFVDWPTFSQSVGVYISEFETEDSTAKFMYLPYSRILLAEKDLEYHLTYVVRGVQNRGFHTAGGWVSPVPSSRGHAPIHFLPGTLYNMRCNHE